MHDCPHCDRKCSCDMEDSEIVSREWVLANCVHECEDGGWWDDEEEDWPDVEETREAK